MHGNSRHPLGDVLKALFGKRAFFGGQTWGISANGPGIRHIFLAAALGLATTLSRPLKVLEIGSWTGSSALSLTQAMRSFSSFGGSLTCLDSWEHYLSEADVAKGEPYESMESLLELDLPFNLFLHNTQTIDNDIKLRTLRGKSGEILPTLTPASFDLIYIDGSHYYVDVLKDLRDSHYLLRDGGILCGDDLELQYGNFDSSYALNYKREDVVRDPATNRLFHPGVTLATSEFFGRVISEAMGFWAVRKHLADYEDVAFEGLRSIIPNHFPDALKTECRAMLKEDQNVLRINREGNPDAVEARLARAGSSRTQESNPT